MKNRFLMLGVAGALTLGVSAQQLTPRENFLKQQAVQRVQAIEQQMDLLQNNYEELARRVGKLESGGSENAALRAEIQSLRSQLGELRTKLSSQRDEIVRELSGKMAQVMKAAEPRPAPPPPKKAEKQVPQGPVKEYVVQGGDTLSLIAKAFGTSVRKIKELNSLKKDVLQVGQKIYVPGE